VARRAGTDVCVARRVVAAIAVTAAVAAAAVVAAAADERGPKSGPREPRAGGDYAPSLVEGTARGHELADVDTCAACHARQAARWRASAHSFASFDNPVYRASIDALRQDVGRAASRHCGGCHDPALLVDGALDRAVAPGDERAHVGVGCRVCHGAAGAATEGNGSYRLRSGPLPLPSLGDPASVAVHRRAARSFGALCLSCHRSFLDHRTGNESFLPGMDDAGAWQRSRLGQGVGEWLSVGGGERRTCVDCHMPGGDHGFAGGHTWMAALRGDDDHGAAIAAGLRGAATVDIAAALTRDGRRWLAPTGIDASAADEWVFDVVVANRRVGHRFPGGIADAGASWIEVAVVDDAGRALAMSGAEPDASAHVLRAQLIDDAGDAVDDRRVHRARAVAWNHTVASGDARLVRFRWLRDAAAVRAQRLRVRLMHQTRAPAVAARACRAHRSARGQAFARAGRLAVSPCVEQPRIVVSEVELSLVESAGNPRAWRRLYDLGRATLGHTQEQVGAAREPLRRALWAAPTARARAAVLVALGRLAIRQGRTSRALWWLRLARWSLGGAAAAEGAVIDRWVGRAFASVWRWQAAIEPLSRAAAAAPGDPSAAVDLATALIAAGRLDAARDAIDRGLHLEPRNPALLRLQHLAWKGDARALRAYEASLSRDDAHDLAARCARRSIDCARERAPIHEHRLEAVAAP